MDRRRKAISLILAGAAAILAAEAALPPERQLSARVCTVLIDAYQAVGSPAVRACGVRCRYQPSCSRYAEQAISHYGMLPGVTRTLGRLWRCSPWGGWGYDPAVPPFPSEDYQNRRLTEEEKRALKEAGKACGYGALTCVIGAILSLAVFVVNVLLMVWVYKDAKARGDQNGVVWLLILFFFPLVGLLVYVFVRPKGNLLPCGGCRQRRLETLPKCPHCGQEGAA